MKSLEDILNSVEAPDPGEALKARILREAIAQHESEALPIAANDNGWKKWTAFAAVFLVMAVAGITLFSPSQEISEAELWAEAAEGMGYEDLYAWVNEGDYVEEQEESFLKLQRLPT